MKSGIETAFRQSWLSPHLNPRTGAVGLLLIGVLIVTIAITGIASIDIGEGDTLLEKAPGAPGGASVATSNAVFKFSLIAGVLAAGVIAALSLRSNRGLAVIVSVVTLAILVVLAVLLPSGSATENSNTHAGLRNFTTTQVMLAFGFLTLVLLFALLTDRNRWAYPAYAVVLLASLVIFADQLGDLFGNRADASTSSDGNYSGEFEIDPRGPLSIPLETGGSVIVSAEGVLSTVPSITSKSIEAPERVPLFIVRNSGRTGYLRTAVSDDPDEFVSDQPGFTGYVAGSDLRDEQIPIDGLAVLDRPVDRISVLPARIDEAFGDGPVSVPVNLLEISADGRYSAESMLFSSDSTIENFITRSESPTYDIDFLNAAVISPNLGDNSPLPGTSNRIAQLASQITKSGSTVFEQAVLIEEFLLRNHRYGVSSTTSAGGVSAVTALLFENRPASSGTFSAAFVMLARSAGMSARAVSGWAISPDTGAQIVHADQAHQWAEVAFEGTGWLQFDPTPGGATDRTDTDSKTAIRFLGVRPESELSDDAEGQDEPRNALSDLQQQLATAAAASGLTLEQDGSLLLENGSSIEALDDNTLILAAGLSADRAVQPPVTPVFQVSGAGQTGYLRTATGGTYRLGEWDVESGPQLAVDPARSIPDTLRQQLPSMAVSADGQPRDDDLLLAVPQGAFEFERILLEPAGSASRLVGGAVPVPEALISASTGGSYDPVSWTFQASQPFESASLMSALRNLTPEFLNQRSVKQLPLYLELPDDLPARITDLAHAVAGDPALSDYQKAVLLEQHLTTSYQYGYADEFSNSVPASTDPVDWFLFESQVGTCGNFSSAFVLMARVLGLPSRVVSGWAISPTSRPQTVFSEQAHQWVEVAFEGVGWVGFDPTPAGAGDRTPADSSSTTLPSGGVDGTGGSSSQPDGILEPGESISLENGSSVAVSPSADLLFGAGLSNDTASEPELAPVFEVTGATNTGYLRTATGADYLNGRWVPESGPSVEVSSGQAITGVADSWLREQALDPFDSPEYAEALLPVVRSPDSIDEITLRPAIAGGAFASGPVPVPGSLIEADSNGSYKLLPRSFAIQQERQSVSVLQAVTDLTVAELNAAPTLQLAQYLHIPESVPNSVIQLAVSVAGDPSLTDFERATELERFLKTTYTYAYADSDSEHIPPGRDPVDWFLFEVQKGTCGNFSSAFTLMARAVGLSSRVVSGWAISPVPGKQVVFSDQAHQWAEVAFEGIGWVTFDPTASGGAQDRPEGAPSGSTLPRTENQDPPVPTATSVPSTTPTPTPSGTPTIPGPTATPAPTSTPAPTGPRVETTTSIDEISPSAVRFNQEAHVLGTVTAANGSIPNGLVVDVYVNDVDESAPLAEKLDGASKVGSGTVVNGRFDVVITITRETSRGRNQVIAVTQGNSAYVGSDSDPPILVIASTTLSITVPETVLVGEPARLVGRLSDEFGVAQSNMDVEISLLGDTQSVRTGIDGGFEHTFSIERAGPAMMSVLFLGDEFLLASTASATIRAQERAQVEINAPVKGLVGEPLPVSFALTSRGTALRSKNLVVRITGEAVQNVTTGLLGVVSTSFVPAAPGRYSVSATFEGDDLAQEAFASAEVRVVTEISLELDVPEVVLTGEAIEVAGKASGPGINDFSTFAASVFVDGARQGSVSFEPDGEFSTVLQGFASRGERTVVVVLDETDVTSAASGSSRIAVAEETTLQLNLPQRLSPGESGTLTGTLKNSLGQPATDRPVLINAERSVNIRPSSVTTDESGTFSVEIIIVEPGTHVLTANHPGGDFFAMSSVSGNVSAANEVIELDAPLSAAPGEDLVIAGSFTRDGAAASGQPVTLRWSDSRSVDAVTGVGGKFELKLTDVPERPVGWHDYTVLAGKGSTAVRAEVAVRTPITLEATAPGRAGKGKALEVTFSATDGRGSPVPGLMVGALGADATTVTDTQGFGTISILVPDDWEGDEFVANLKFDGSPEYEPASTLVRSGIAGSVSLWPFVIGLAGIVAGAGAGFAGSVYLRSRSDGGQPVSRGQLNPSHESVFASAADTSPAILLAPQPALSIPIAATELDVSFRGPLDQVPQVTGIGEEIRLHSHLERSVERTPIEGEQIVFTMNGDDIDDVTTDIGGHAVLSRTQNSTGVVTIDVVFTGSDALAPSSAKAQFAVVDYREGIISLFNRFASGARSSHAYVRTETTPREMERLLVQHGSGFNEEDLERLIRLFELADYSTHEIRGRDFAEMWTVMTKLLQVTGESPSIEELFSNG